METKGRTEDGNEDVSGEGNKRSGVDGNGDRDGDGRRIMLRTRAPGTGGEGQD